MKVSLVFAPREGEKAAQSLDFEMLDVPRPGDLVTIVRPGQEGASSFVVRRRCWTLDYPECGPANPRAGQSVVGKALAVAVECEFSVGPFASEEHQPLARATAK